MRVMRIFRNVTMMGIIACCVFGFLLFTFGWYASRYQTLYEVRGNTAQPVRYADPGFPLISPLVSIAIPNATGFPELKTVKNEVSAIIEDAKDKGNVSDAGVYFRLPKNAHWFGVNENNKFDPGSLIKVPIMIALLKEAEINPKILTKEIAYNSNLLSDIPDALVAQLATGRYGMTSFCRQ